MDTSVNAGQIEFWNSGPGQNWARHQQALDTLHEGITRLLIDAAAPAAGERVLDIGCGAGASTFALARAVGARGEVLGVDVSAPLLERAEARRRELQAGNIAFLQADAQVHRFEPGAWDLAASRLGTMFFADTAAAFRNLCSALRSGGRLVFVAWQGPEQNPWFTIPQELAVARLGPVAESPPEAPGPMAFRDPERVLRLMRDAGLGDCRAEPASAELHHPGGVEAAVALAQHVGPISRTLREKGGSAQDLAAIAEALADALQRFRSDDGVRIPAALTVFSAVRP